MTNNTQIAIFGGGCFWCTEAIFARLNGVISVKPGYAGGSLPDPSYHEVCEGTTGHAEVIQIEFDPAIISYNALLDVFFHTHDPTTLNKQGADVGTQYRSVIFYTTDEQKQHAEEMITQLNAENEFGSPIVTHVEPLDTFYEAENYHHDYFAKNEYAPYCQVVISPKVQKLYEKYGKLTKE